MRRLWVLNFDAEDELDRGAGYTPSGAMRDRTFALAHAFAAGLPKGDVILDVDGEGLLDLATGVRETPLDLRALPRPTRRPNLRADALDDLQPRAWCPTQRALRTFSRVSRTLDAPDVAVLRHVNARAFAHALAEDELEGARSARTLEEVEEHVARPSPTGAWLLKRSFGMAGRGQRPIAPGRLSDPDRAFVEASLRRGPLQIEPRVSLARELTIHGWVDRDVRVTTVREQLLHERAWVTSVLATGLPPRVENAVVDASERVGHALAAAGYRGPFGVDAYEWRTPSGATALRTIGEINARFCMDWDARDGWDPQ
jgi:hypothetical protein